MVAEPPSRADFCWDGRLDGKFQKGKRWGPMFGRVREIYTNIYIDG